MKKDFKNLIKSFKSFNLDLKKLERKSNELVDLSIATVYASFEAWSKNDLKIYYGEDINLAEKLYKEYLELDKKYSDTIEEIHDWQTVFDELADGYNEFDFSKIEMGLKLIEELGGDT